MKTRDLTSKPDEEPAYCIVLTRLELAAIYRYSRRCRTEHCPLELDSKMAAILLGLPYDPLDTEMRVQAGCEADRLIEECAP